MIDTIVLTLSQNMFAILDHDKFSPSTTVLYGKDLQMGSRLNAACFQNPTKKDYLQGNYKPRLTVRKRFTGYRNYEITLKIELSLPKLVFLNNFDELEESHFNQIINLLQTKLTEMGVRVYTDNLINAPVSAIHYSKNIPLTDHTIPQTYLKQLKKLNINKKLDTNQTDYRNEGQSFKYRTNSFEIAFYDKLADLEQAKISPKRSEEKKDIVIQLNLFDKHQLKEPFQVLRMEVRLNTRRKIKSILNKLNITKEPTLKDLFNLKTAIKVLNHYLDEIEEAYPPLLLLEEDKALDLFSTLLAPNNTPATALKLVGLHQILKESGVREFRDMIDPISKNYWYSLNKQMKRLTSKDYNSVFSLIKPHITDYTPLRLVDYENKMLNNDK